MSAWPRVSPWRKALARLLRRLACRLDPPPLNINIQADTSQFDDAITQAARETARLARDFERVGSM